MTTYLVDDPHAARGTAPVGLTFPRIAVNASASFHVGIVEASAAFHLIGYTGADSLSDEFARLNREWRADTSHLSSPSHMAMHPAYQRIIGLGDRVIPLVLTELSRHGGHWYWALHALTGASPIPQGANVTLRDAKGAWIAWGRHRGYIR